MLAIYQAGIDEGNATLETRAPDWSAFTAARLPGHRLVATEAGQIAGWVAASATSGRQVYAGVVEHSVYVHPGAGARASAAVSWTPGSFLTHAPREVMLPAIPQENRDQAMAAAGRTPQHRRGQHGQDLDVHLY